MDSATTSSTSKMNWRLLLSALVLANCCWQTNGATCCPKLCSCTISAGEEEVVCSEDSLTNFPKDSLSNSTTRLSFLSTNLSVITAGDLSAVPHLKKLQLYHNPIRKLPGHFLQSVPHLNSLDLTGNKLVRLPPDVFSHAPLRSLVLRDNMIEEADGEWFSSSSNLTWLDLSGNRLKTVPLSLLQRLPHLKELDLSTNNITEVPSYALNHLPKLESLNLAGNKLATLDTLTFVNTNQITHLFLQENQLQHLPPNLFQSLQNLELLLLNKNRLQNLPSGLLGQLPHQGERGSPLKVMLSQNLWACDAKMEYLWKWLTVQSENVFFLEEVICSTPERLRDRQVVSLTAADLGLNK